ncbi:4-hydroxythreonine-4-phosphate dehydrogenase PdxA [Veronia pacifica]|uniref:4-hydroxythreonine-4-phosphate dehydrogenase n=1 Tax=Veronia pacifica TaxID=1080227 RepID=A0A1C3EME5_9GAMM|nr:4-hydroxythreonine-4-phosphate dehydrogenase PdxA [Veronia pacifica]ODA34408.1 4-hydroxythreonine-4-phosphate dehydrogenase [Veronia pacifica]
MRKPIVAVTLGDPSGIGPELIAKLFTSEARDKSCNCVIVGDPWVWEQAQNLTGLISNVVPVSSFEDVADSEAGQICFLPVNSIERHKLKMAEANPDSGKAVLDVLTICLDAAEKNLIDAICFAPLNKQAMIMAGMPFEDELHFFADYFKVKSYFCEFNTLGDIWTSRISSHVPLKDVTPLVTKERIIEASKLIHESLVKSGVEHPRVAVAGLNPHAGDGGVCGREEIEIIKPAVDALNELGYPVQGPFPADTIFLKVRDGEFHAVVTMYHDQGQIAIKLLGFEKGVTVQGGLPVVITTPAHGTAFDIANKNKANVQATLNAYNLACVMGTAQFNSQLTAQSVAC